MHGGRGEGEGEVTANEYGVSFRGDEDVLELEVMVHNSVTILKTTNVDILKWLIL